MFKAWRGWSDIHLSKSLGFSLILALEITLAVLKIPIENSPKTSDKRNSW